MILITGSTGNFGGSTAGYLQQKGIAFTAASNSLEALQNNFGNTVPLAVFDWDRPETFPSALKGVKTVYIVSPPFTTNFHQKAAPFIAAAKAAGVQHIVLLTALFAGIEGNIFYETETLVKNSGVAYTIIRPGFLFQNFINYDLQSVKNGVIFAPSGNGKTSYVDVRNVGEAAAAILANPAAHNGKTYSITGSEAFTHQQMAAIFTQQLSKQVVHVNPAANEYITALEGYNVPAFIAAFMAMLYTTVSLGQWQEVSNDYTLLTGKPATSFDAFVRENKTVFTSALETATA